MLPLYIVHAVFEISLRITTVFVGKDCIKAEKYLIIKNQHSTLQSSDKFLVNIIKLFMNDNHD